MKRTAAALTLIAASAFGLEAMLDVASRLADEKRNDVRIEAAIAKLYGSEIGWKVLDELVQVRGGRRLLGPIGHQHRPRPVGHMLVNKRLEIGFPDAPMAVQLHAAQPPGPQIVQHRERAQLQALRHLLRC